MNGKRETTAKKQGYGTINNMRKTITEAKEVCREQHTKDKELITAMENLALPDITQSIDKDIKKEVNKEVIGQTIDLLGDNIEIGLDVVIDNELLKEIPCIGNFIKAERLALRQCL